MEHILQPDMGEPLEAFKVLPPVEGFEKFKGAAGVRYEAGLPGNAEFLLETGVDHADGSVAVFHAQGIA
jgi:hypothetical protein